MANKDNKALKYVKILFPYFFDWAVIYAIWKIKEFMYVHSKSFERKFSIFDESISYPGKPDSLPWADLLHYTLTICVIIIVVVQLIKRNFTYGLNQAILGLWFSYLVTNTFSDYIKDFAGRYRPDFLYYCDVDFQKVEEQYQYYRNITGGLDLEDYGPRKLFNTTICRGDPSKIASEQKSFPSGHTSFAFTTMIYLTLYLAGQLRIFDGQARGWKYLICCVPIFFASYVPFSRLMDYRHHWSDCLAGAIIGTFFAVIFYYLFYPSLRDPDCDKPIKRPCNFNFFKKEKKEKIDEVEEDDEVPKENKADDEVQKNNKAEDIV